MTERVTLIARARAKASGAERLLKELRQLEAAAPSEPGCISYELFQLADNPLEFMLHETWETAGHLQAHLGSAAMQAFFGMLPDLLDGQPEMTSWKRVR